MKKFFVRVVTSIIIAGTFLAAFILLPSNWIIGLISALTGIIALEYTQLVFYQKNENRSRIQLLFLYYLSYILLFTWLTIIPSSIIEGIIFSASIFLFTSFWLFHSQTTANTVKNIGLALIGLFYLVYPAILFLKIFLYDPQGREWLIWILCVVFTGDIFAYLFGSILSGKKWMAHISPQKTYSGLICGLLSAGFMSIATSIYLSKQSILYANKPALFFMLGILCFLVAQTGDLLISVFKRQAKVKDTGRLLPGHGGWLDRLDGLLLALPFMYSIFTLLKFPISEL